MQSNPFIQKTVTGLDASSIRKDLLAPRGFDIDGINDNEEQCVLVMGLNPAGGKRDAEREMNFNRTYYFSLNENCQVKSEWLYNKYFRPIYNFVNRCLKDLKTDGPSAKWPWCNKPWESIENEIRSFPDLCPSGDIESFFQKHQDSPYTIYIGDMFYYHVTNSKDLPLITDKQNISYKKYCEDMLALHINELERHKKKVRFVYINNAQVSHWLSGDVPKTFGVVPGTTVKVFYGGMLSGMRSLDAFSLERLIQEVRREI